MPEGRVAAFFDFDRTLLDTESSRLGIRYLWERRMVSAGYILRVLAANLLYQRHWLSEERMAAVLMRVYRGRRLEDFRQGAAEFYRARLKPRLAPAMLERLDWHRGRGHVRVLVSGSVRYMLEPVAADLGFDHLLCTELAQGPDGRLSGKPDGPLCLGARKRELAERLAEAHGLDLARSYAYGNHQSDLPLLERVGHPHAVEPTGPLLAAARQRGWPVLGFR